ncbi:hypothetical protein COBT_002746 [Conglomerata obtusa]
MTDDFNNLKNALHTRDGLEKLKTFGDVVESMTQYIIESKNKSSDISYLSESIKKQKLIFEQAERLYEVIRVEEEDTTGDVDVMVEKLEGTFGDYKAFVEGFGSN